MTHKDVSPKINSIKWGQITVGNHETLKDAKLFPSGFRKWDWNETGTRHKPGIQPADVKELLSNKSQIVILSQGFHQRLQVCESTKDLLINKGVEFYILETEQAVKKYNELRTKQPVGALIHSNC